MAGDLDAEPGLQADAVPPVDDAADRAVDVLVDGLPVAPLLVDAEAGDHDVAVELVEDDGGVPDALHAVEGQVVVLAAAQVHVVGGVDREVDVHPLGHVAQPSEAAEGLRHGRGHEQQVVVLLDRLVGVVDGRLVADGLDHEVLGDVADGHADLLVVRGAGVGSGADHLDLERAEAEVVDILDAVFERAPFAREGYSGRTEPYHECPVPAIGR